jgi:4-amino-4-deoxy-L-arabinose transferase-like glycosyltransferase
MFIDEIYTYGLSNSHYQPFLKDVAGGSLENAVLTRQDLLDYVIVNDGEALDFGSVYYNQVQDVHPPLYYWLFHLVSCLTPNVYSKWTGLGLNLLLLGLTLLALYQLVMTLFNSRTAALAAVILYGLSGLGLASMLLIRMYMLMTLFSVLLALWIARLMQQERRRYYPLVGLTVFLGLLTQYYFVFYAFFVCAAYVFWAMGKKRWKSLALFAVSAFAGVGLLLLVFPACIQHLTADKLVSGGNALEQLSAFSQYRFRLLLFFREARHGMKAAVLVALALALCLLLCCKKLRAAGKAGSLPWSSLVILLPAFAAFVVVALVSPVTEQRYIYNLAPFFAASVSFLIVLLERSLGSFSRERLWKGAALLLMLALSLGLARWEPPMYLYPKDPRYVDSYAEYDALAAAHGEEPCLYLTEYSYPLTQDLGELLYFQDFFVTGDPDAPALDAYLAARPSDACVVYIDVSEAWSSGFDPEEMLPALLASTEYTESELLYENGLSVAYLLRK